MSLVFSTLTGACGHRAMTVVSWHLANCGPCTRPAHLWPSTDAPTPVTAAVVSSPPWLCLAIIVHVACMFVTLCTCCDSLADRAVTAALLITYQLVQLPLLLQVRCGPASPLQVVSRNSPLVAMLALPPDCPLLVHHLLESLNMPTHVPSATTRSSRCTRVHHVLAVCLTGSTCRCLQAACRWCCQLTMCWLCCRTRPALVPLPCT